MFGNEGDYMCQQCELDQYTTHLTVVIVDSEYVLILALFVCLGKRRKRKPNVAWVTWGTQCGHKA